MNQLYEQHEHNIAMWCCASRCVYIFLQRMKKETICTYKQQKGHNKLSKGYSCHISLPGHPSVCKSFGNITMVIHGRHLILYAFCFQSTYKGFITGTRAFCLAVFNLHVLLGNHYKVSRMHCCLGLASYVICSMIACMRKKKE
jgi:hypothetical protein